MYYKSCTKYFDVVAFLRTIMIKFVVLLNYFSGHVQTQSDDISQICTQAFGTNIYPNIPHKYLPKHSAQKCTQTFGTNIYPNIWHKNLHKHSAQNVHKLRRKMYTNTTHKNVHTEYVQKCTQTLRTRVQ